MWSFISLPQNLPFSVAIMVVLLIAFMEGVGAMMGAGVSHVIETLFPSIDFDVPAPDLHMTAIDKALSWLRIGQLPILVWIIIALTTFGLVGLILQGILYNTWGAPLPGVLMSMMSLMISLPVVRYLTGVLAEILPKEETSAVSLDALVGRIAVVTLGKASYQNPTRAKVKDNFGYTHYILLEPDIKTECFEHGQAVLLVKRAGSIFYGIENPNEVMINSEEIV